MLEERKKYVEAASEYDDVNLSKNKVQSSFTAKKNKGSVVNIVPMTDPHLIEFLKQ